VGGAVAGGNWTEIAARTYLPVVSGIYARGAVHRQDKQYKKGKIITQSAVGLLQYPLEVEFPTEIKINDLLYYQEHTKDNGFYTGARERREREREREVLPPPPPHTTTLVFTHMYHPSHLMQAIVPTPLPGLHLATAPALTNSLAVRFFI
jgi:hypothetical protein